MDILDVKIKALSIKNDLLGEINETLTNVENCKKWFNKYGPFSKATLESILQICTAESQESANQPDLKYSAIETIAKKCIEAKIRIEKGKTTEALTVINDTKMLLGECKEDKYFADAYAAGFEFVVQCLQVETDTKRKDGSIEELN